MNNYYTYAYLREDGTPYYIGKGIKGRIHSKLHTVSLPIRERRIFLKRNLSAEDASMHEIYMIFILGRKDLGTGILRNLTDGGEGNPGRKMSEETKNKIRKANVGYKPSPEALMNMSKSRKGKPWTEMQRVKIMQGLKNVRQDGKFNPNWGKRWWNNGIKSVMSKTCPGEGYTLGRLYKRSNK